MSLSRSTLVQLAEFRRAALLHHPDLNDSPQAQEKFRNICYAWAREKPPMVLLWTGKEETVDQDALPSFENYSLARAYNEFSQAFPVATLFSWRPGEPEALFFPVPLRVNDVLLGNFKTACITCDEVCPECSGTGRVPAAGACICCSGEGVVQRDEKIRFEVVPGCLGGSIYHVNGEGEYSPRFRRRGDLVLVFQERFPVEIVRDGAHVEIPAEVDAWTLILGGAAQAKGLQGDRVDFRIPAGVLEGATVRIAGRGFPFYHRNGRGDLVLRLRARFPETLADDELMLVQQLRDRGRKSVTIRSQVIGSFTVLELTPTCEGPALEDELLELALAVIAAGGSLAMDVRAYGSGLSDFIVSLLLNVYHKVQKKGLLRLIGAAGIMESLNRLQLGSLFLILKEPQDLVVQTFLLEDASPEELKSWSQGKWLVYRFGGGPLNSAVLLDRPDYLEAFEAQGSVFRALDVSLVGFVDSYAIGKMVQLYRFAHAAGGRVALVRPQARVLSVLRDTGVVTLFTVVESCDDLDN